MPAFFFSNSLLAVLLFAAASCDALRTKELRRLEIKVGGNNVSAEIAATPEDRERGLMYRTKMGADEGMLFVFVKPEIQTFWMKNTLIPLDIGFFDSDQYLIQSMTMEPDDGKATYGSGDLALYALEMNKGWFKSKGLRKYAKLDLPQTLKGL
ncbi:MAG: DUF192 domain-containing protein [Spirochaetia bacterium]|nr:DUF192 domain-containing protein [Spirochaetia bacterium]